MSKNILHFPYVSREYIKILLSEEGVEKIYLVSLVDRTGANQNVIEVIAITTKEELIHEYAERYAQKQRPPIRSYKPFIEKTGSKTRYYISRGVRGSRPGMYGPKGIYVEVWETNPTGLKKFIGVS